MLQYSQFLIFELGAKCNLASVHPKCPVSKRQKGKNKLDDETIIRLAEKAYNEMGFTGLIGWHFYNEPMLEWKRMSKLMEKIREKVPQSRFLLWTNGTNLVDDPKVDMFEKVVVTDYYNQGAEHFKKFYRNELDVHTPNFDERLAYDSPGSSQPCLRPFIEFIINAYGDVILCCQDWENRVSIGNVLTDSFEELVAARLEISKKIAKYITPENHICYHCNGKIGLVPFDGSIYNRTMEFVGKL